MGLGGSILLMAAGGILAFATDWNVNGLDVQVMGWIMMLAGFVGLVVISSVQRRRRAVAPPTEAVVEERHRYYE
ncbi:DUF6458 family protein [Streptomyces aculeolatus]|jgi:predicted CDP-diglyceride synthetase/phosphatidate cytidylyltransferase|uniref:DUF6458 family protein n=1 Tax=Streptomyces TaxID=1883 RepID=UPI0003A6F7C3|nr:MULTISPECIES: DUF6458 family protein [Streptomyces]